MYAATLHAPGRHPDKVKSGLKEDKTLKFDFAHNRIGDLDK